MTPHAIANEALVATRKWGTYDISLLYRTSLTEILIFNLIFER